MNDAIPRAISMDATVGLAKCSACTKGDHISCEYMLLPFCACWRNWHGMNEAPTTKIVNKPTKGKR